MNNIKCLELVKSFQSNNCIKSERQLLERYYLQICNYAHKFAINNTYSNLLQFDRSEIESYVYFAFRKAIETYKHDENSVSFKNYLYQMVKYETFKQMRTYFNWQAIKNYDQQHSFALREFRNCGFADEKYLHNIDISMKIEAIHDFLKRKTNRMEYPEIWNMKCRGIDNETICKYLNLTLAELKSKFQYIKKLILINFKNIDQIK